MTVLTIGTFDRVHIGHLELFAACRRRAGSGGQVVVSVNTDDFVERFKGRRPMWDQEYRMTMLRALRDVDLVIGNTGDEYAGRVIAQVRPRFLLVGDDWAPPKDYLGQLHVTQAFLDDRGITVEFVPRTTGESTTSIRARLSSNGVSGGLGA
jgi:cytidyltransferase-like protein